MHDSDGHTFLDVPIREGKPRSRGLTHVMDKGLNLREIEGLFDTAGVFAGIFVLMLMAAGLNELIKVAERRLLRWRPPLPDR